MSSSGTGGRHLSDWTPEERAQMREAFQNSFEATQRHVEAAEIKGKDVFVKEHAPWMLDPVGETEWLFGKDSVNEEPWMVEASAGQTRSEFNKSVLPDEVLLDWEPTFLIRHPALVFPSIYRTSVDLEGLEEARASSSRQAVEMTLNGNRLLYDFYARQFPNGGPRPIVLDAHDIIMTPEVIRKYSEMIGLDPARLKFSWKPASEEEIDKTPFVGRRMKSTLLASAGILKDKTTDEISIEEESIKWRREFGEEVGRRMERWVTAAMPDYDYMRAKRLRPEVP